MALMNEDYSGISYDMNPANRYFVDELTASQFAEAQLVCDDMMSNHLHRFQIALKNMVYNVLKERVIRDPNEDDHQHIILFRQQGVFDQWILSYKLQQLGIIKHTGISLTFTPIYAPIVNITDQDRNDILNGKYKNASSALKEPNKKS